MDILENIDPEFNETIQMVIFFLNPFYNVDGNDLLSNTNILKILQLIKFQIMYLILMIF